MPNHSLFIAAGELPRPNVYLVTLRLKEQGAVYATHSLFLAADAPRGVIGKLRRIMPDRYGVMPHRFNCEIKMKRMVAKDYVQPGFSAAIPAAMMNAHSLGERDMVEALRKRPAEVREALNHTQGPTAYRIDADAAAEALTAALSAIDGPAAASKP